MHAATTLRFVEILLRTAKWPSLITAITSVDGFYVCTEWILTEAKKLDAFQYKCVKRTLKIRWYHIQEITGVNRAGDGTG